MARQGTDVRLLLDAGSGEPDIAVVPGDLAVDHGLGTCVLVSLFTDARLDDAGAEVDPGERRGYWADRAGDRWGSLLWTLDRANLTPQTVARAEEYSRAALEWLVDEGIADAVNVEATAEASCLRIAVRVEPGRDPRWAHLWEGTRLTRYQSGSVQLEVEAA